MPIPNYFQIIFTEKKFETKRRERFSRSEKLRIRSHYRRIRHFFSSIFGKIWRLRKSERFQRLNAIVIERPFVINTIIVLIWISHEFGINSKSEFRMRINPRFIKYSDSRKLYISDKENYSEMFLLSHSLLKVDIQFRNFWSFLSKIFEPKIFGRRKMLHFNFFGTKY